MVAVFPTRRRAEVFARALEGERTTDARLQELVTTAARMAAVPLVEPRAEFRDSLRARLMEAATAELPAQAAAAQAAADTAAPSSPVVTDDHRSTRRRRRLVAAATGLVLVGGGTGVAAASEQALPGEMLYPIKRTLEAAEVSFARGASGEGRALLDRAATRLEEAQALSAAGTTSALDVDAIEGAIDDFSSDAAAGGERLLAAFTESGDPSDVEALRAFTAESHEVLTDLAQRLPPAVRPALSEADETVVSLDSQAVRLCPECTDRLSLLNVLSEQVVPPEPAADASPHVAGRGPLSVAPKKDVGRPGADGRSEREGTVTRAPKARAGGTPTVPEVPLDTPATSRQQDQNAAPRTGRGASQPQQELGLDGLLQPPRPSLPPRPTGGADPRDVGRVTEPLTDPLDPLLEDTPENTEDGLKKTTDGLRTTDGSDQPTQGLRSTTDGLADLL